MFWTKKKRYHFYQNKIFISMVVVLFFGIIIRAMLPAVMTTLVNKRLMKESPNFLVQIHDIDLHLLRGQYVLKGVVGSMKPEGENFLKIQSVVASVPWKPLFQGNAVVDVMVNKMNLTASQKLLDRAKSEGERLKDKMAKEKDSQREEKDELPVQISSVNIQNSQVTIKDFMSFKGEETREVTNIDAVISNLTPTPNNPETNIKLSANVFGPAPFMLVGVARLKEGPLRWDVNSVLKNFDLTSLNPFIKDKVQAFIEKGKLDLYTEAAAIEGKIEGYVKPFVSKMKMDTPPGGFQFKGAAAATGGNMVKLLLTDSEAKTLATNIPFTLKGKEFEYEVLPALTKAVEHRAKQNISPGIEDKIGQKGLGIKEGETMQAQEEK